MKALWTLIGAAAVSMATASLVAHFRSFRISEVGGYFYLFVASPLAGGVVGLIAYFGLRPLLFGWRAVGGGILTVGILSIIGHAWALDHGKIGGEYLAPKQFDPKGMSSEGLFHALDDRNLEVAGRAWVEIEARAEQDPELMWQAVQLFRRAQPTRYVDSYRTLDAIAFLARRADRRAIPILQEVLRSQETSLVTPPGGASQVVYHNRAFAQDLLSRYFGMSVETSPQPSGTQPPGSAPPVKASP